MYRKNDQHRQKPIFSSLFDLPDKEKERLARSWAATFYQACFCRIDEDIFAILYSDTASRPNIPVNVLVGLEILKSGFGWSDAELEDALHFNLQVRYALGYSSLDEGHFELRTVYNFRQRLARHMQETGENLLDEVFEQITDAQIERLQVKTGKLRMDSTQIGSNIRQMSRLQLLVEVVQRVWRMLGEEAQAQYAAAFAPYVNATSGQYTYHIPAGQGQAQLEVIGALMRQLVNQLATHYADEPAYVLLCRVYDEHFITADSGARPKAGAELSAQSLQSPDDWEATYRKKKGQGYRGYVTNITETCDPENGLQLIVKVQTEANRVDDAVLLEAAIPNLLERTEVNEMHTDGGYNSAEVDQRLTETQIEQFQTAIRGKKSEPQRLGVCDFVFTRRTDGTPQTVCCPQGQTVEVRAARKAGRFTALFDRAGCARCPLAAHCPTKSTHRKPGRLLYCNQQQVNVAHRCENQRQASASGRNLRSAVEATVRSVKHPFRDGQVPVRGKTRVSMMMIASAAMTNVRRIWRYQRAKSETESIQRMGEYAQKQVTYSSFSAYFRSFLRFRAPPAPYLPAVA